MDIENSFVTAIRALRRNKLRSALTSIGIIIGVSSVIVMIGVGSSARIAVKEKIYTDGANAISVYKSVRPLTDRDVSSLIRIFPQIHYITPMIYKSYVPAKYKNKSLMSRIYGVNIDYFRIKEWELQYGRYFTDLEIISNDKVVVIGNSVRTELFGFINPAGSVILVNNIPFKVVGTLVETGQSFSGRDYDNLMIMPYTTAQTKIIGSKTFDQINMSAYDMESVDDLVNSVKDYFRRTHNIAAGKPDDFKVETSKEKLKVADYISKSLAILLAFIASISLLVGGVGIMNIMLVSVSERTREIGIRMAIGAKKKDILLQFLIESVSLSSIGGIVGITLGLITYYIIVYFVKWPFLFSFTSVLVSFIFACCVGIFFGYYPAKKAANLRPIDALRFE